MALEKSTTDGGHLLPGEIANQIFNTTDSLLSAHKQFKLDLESRMLSWETPPTHPEEKNFTKAGMIDDVIIDHMQRLKV